MPITIKPDVIDVSSWNSVEDWFAVKNSGIKGIIHKASEGVGFVDRTYAKRKADVERTGMLWGSYHFMNRAPADQQAKHYIKASLWTPGANMLLCCDWEPYGANTATLAQAKEFLRIVYEETGQRPVLYSGNLVKEQGRGDPFLCQHRLWLAQYTQGRPQLPRGWSQYWMWQYAGDGIFGTGTIPGISTKGIDCNTFGGVDLAAEWAGRLQDRRNAPTPEPSESPYVEPVDPAETAASASVAGSVGTTAESVSLTSRIVTASSTAAAINELSDQGSRLGNLFRTVKQRFWKAVATTGAVGGAAGGVVKTDQGNAATIADWAQAHPIAFGCIIGGGIGLLVGGILLYFVVKRGERWLATAYNAGRYEPRKEA